MTEQVRRAARLVEIERRLRQSPAGLTVRDLARQLDCSPRTIQRDLIVLESELGVPLLEAPGRRWQLLPGSTPIGSVRFNLQEARAVFLATRLLLRHADERDPDAISALEKLAAALPPPLAAQVRSAATQLKERPARRPQTEVLRTLTDAWASSQTVTLRYRSQAARAIRRTELDPYLLEPSTTGAAVYVIGYSHEHGQVRTFKLDRIQAVEPTGRTFVAADLHALEELMRRSWGVVFGEDQYDVVVDFTPAVADRVAETRWHPSQRLARTPAGGLRLELRLPSLLEFVPWVRSWGAEARVVAPPELREDVARTLRAAADQYATA
ncbi:MAG: WYL domain-containing protein [Dehalococcoidia bacterium]|nr:WYL domain-containing protein [Dehalococcoidia bacterium]